MMQTFFEYLLKEQKRLDKALARALQRDEHDESESLHQQRRIVQDQLNCWSRDLFPNDVAA